MLDVVMHTVTYELGPMGSPFPARGYPFTVPIHKVAHKTISNWPKVGRLLYTG